VKFRDLAIGDRFQFTSGIWNYVCVKTSKRRYETVEQLMHVDGKGAEFWAPMRLEVGTTNVEVAKFDPDAEEPA
jgi:hypothetical protein